MNDSTTLFELPLQLHLPTPFPSGHQRVLLVLISLHLYDGARLRAHARWLQTQPILPMRTFPIRGAYVPMLPGVQVYVPANIVVMPLYVRVRSLPGLHLPEPIIIVVQATEYAPGIGDTLELLTDMRFVSSEEVSSSPFLVIPRTIEDAVKASP